MIDGPDFVSAIPMQLYARDTNKEHQRIGMQILPLEWDVETYRYTRSRYAISRLRVLVVPVLYRLMVKMRTKYGRLSTHWTPTVIRVVFGVVRFQSLQTTTMADLIRVPIFATRPSARKFCCCHSLSTQSITTL